MNENTETVEPMELKEARRSFEIAQKKLFGLDKTRTDPGEPNPITNINDDEQVRAATKDAVATGLMCLQMERTQGQVRDIGLRDAMRPQDGGNIDSLIADYERARDTLEGNRSNPASLIKVVSSLSALWLEDENKAHNTVVDNMTNERPWLGRLLGLPPIYNSLSTARETTFHDTQTRQIRGVRDAVIEKASEWGNPPKPSPTA